jgi:hypothetical protein
MSYQIVIGPLINPSFVVVARFRMRRESLKIAGYLGKAARPRLDGRYKNRILDTSFDDVRLPLKIPETAFLYLMSMIPIHHSRTSISAWKHP